MTPKYKNSDAGNSDMPKRSHKVLPLSEKVKVFDLMKKDHIEVVILLLIIINILLGLLYKSNFILGMYRKSSVYRVGLVLSTI